jgi:hypothetical protein
LKKRPICFIGREYLEAVYNSTAQRLVVRASRQVEKSTFLVNAIAHAAVTMPGVTILFVAPRDQQASVFSKTRLMPMVRDSPVIARALVGSKHSKLGIKDVQFINGSTLHVRAAFHSADAVRGLSADILMIDEFQDIADGDLPVLQETLSHSTLGRVILTGTPKLVDNHLERVFRQSTACEWTIPCRNCSRGIAISERALGTDGLICPDCQLAIDPRQGKWVARHPHAVWGQGYWICHPMVPCFVYHDILQKQQAYDPVKFKNECLGLPTTLGEHIVTREEVEACCAQRAMATSGNDLLPQWRGRLLAGLDWGGGAAARTALTIGYMRPDNCFEVCHLARFAANEDPNYLLNQVAQRCQQFGVRFIAADGGGAGFHLNRLLVSRLGLPLYAIVYTASDSPPRQNGVLWDWSVNRTASIGNLFARIKLRRISFPRVEDSGSYLDEFSCEVAEYDDHNRTIRYTHPDTQPDDALHATNYALVMAARAAGHAYCGDEML